MLTPVRRARRTDDGFTLIELIISIGLLGVVFSVLSMVMIGALTANRETRVRLDETRDEQFVAAYFATDADGATNLVAGAQARCGPASATAVAELRGISFTAATPPQPTVTVASYVFSTSTVGGVTTGTLTRYACESAAATPSYPLTPASITIIARSLVATAPSVQCSTGGVVAACVAAVSPAVAPVTMKLTVNRLSGPAAEFVLTGSRRTR